MHQRQAAGGRQAGTGQAGRQAGARYAPNALRMHFKALRMHLECDLECQLEALECSSKHLECI